MTMKTMASQTKVKTMIKVLRCIECGLDFPAGQLDEDEVCEECRRDRVNEDAEEER